MPDYARRMAEPLDAWNALAVWLDAEDWPVHVGSPVFGDMGAAERRLAAFVARPSFNRVRAYVVRTVRCRFDADAE